jgi:hypothetical protein
MAERGAPRGKRQVIAGPRAVLEGRKSVRTVAVLDPAAYLKVHGAAEALGVSVSGYIAQLIHHDQLGDDGRPAWAERLTG